MPLGQSNFLFRRGKELESSDWTQGVKSFSVLISLQLRVPQPGGSVHGHDLISVGEDMGERFIDQESGAERPAGAAAGTRVEPWAQGQHQPFPHTPTYLMEVHFL